MKFLKKNLLFVLIFFALPSFAADLVVEEFGVAPAYSTIQSAITAANAGDRILIKNRTAGIPWLENLTINNSVELLSYENDSTFVMQGNILIGTNITVTILGMVNLTGNISQLTTSGTARGTIVNIIDCEINGYVNLDYNPFRVNFIGNTMTNGFLHLMHGKVIGNDFQQSDVDVVSASSTYSTEDFLIVGNKIVDNSIPLYVNCDGYNMQIKNNFISATSTTSGIYLLRGTSANLIHNVHNNTIKLAGSASSLGGIYIGAASSYYWRSVLEIMNNVVDANSTSSSSRAVYIPASYRSGNINIYFNYFDGSLSNGFNGTPTLDLNNDKTSTFAIPTTGVLPAGHPGIDGGNPALPFYDLDLSVGDAGCFGGSFTLDNFFPLHTGAARVYMVDYPFNVRQGSTLNINADSYDR
jgi:hypothetical protein